MNLSRSSPPFSTLFHGTQIGLRVTAVYMYACTHYRWTQDLLHDHTYIVSDPLGQVRQRTHSVGLNTHAPSSHSNSSAVLVLETALLFFRPCASIRDCASTIADDNVIHFGGAEAADFAG